MTLRHRVRFAGAAAVSLTIAAGAACHLKSPIKPLMAKRAASTLALPVAVINSNPDPEIVRGALSYALLQNEALLVSAPTHDELLLATCRQYVQYASWFVQPDAEAAQPADPPRAQAIMARGAALAIRGKDVCWRALDVEEKGTTARLSGAPDAAAHRFERDDVPLLYWSAAALTAAITMSGRADLAHQWPSARALAERALALDDTWNRAALHELMITIESQSVAGVDAEPAARKHFARAIDVQQGLSPGPYVALAMGVARPKRDRAEFDKLLRQAIAIDPDKDPANRLPIMIGRQRAQILLGQIDRLMR
jgi:predicted anti-sigma-YlaC factor YlaD